MKCPKCKKIYENGDVLFAEQKYKTKAMVILNFKTREFMDSDLFGYGSADELVEDRLVSIGKLKIIGCTKCLK